MKTEYSGVEITYMEDANQWAFELRGRSRTAESLAKAKEAIDKVPAEKKKEFARYDVHIESGYTDSERKAVTLTSFAEKSRYDNTWYAWISNKGDRKKEPCSRLYLINDHNKALWAQIDDLEKQQKSLDAQEKRLRNQLQHPEPLPE